MFIVEINDSISNITHRIKNMVPSYYIKENNLDYGLMPLFKEEKPRRGGARELLSIMEPVHMNVK